MASAFALLLLSTAVGEVAEPFELATATGCAYRHAACSVEPLRSFFEEWEAKTRCWLCNNQELVIRAKAVLQDFLYTERPALPGMGAPMELDPVWKETCLTGYMLALFSTTRSKAVQQWSFYQVGLSLINSCLFDEALFFEMFGITPGQIAYTFYLLGLPYHKPAAMLHIQAPELGRLMPDFGLPSLEKAPLVFDIGMGLGADSRYFLSQGFRVVAVEANSKAIEVAMAIDWVQPMVLEGRLTFLHAAIAPPGEGGSSTTIWALPQRPEQSNNQKWVETQGGVAEEARTLECADLLRLFGRATYMKIDVETCTIDCLESLAASQKTAASGRVPSLPRFLSMELEAASLFTRFHGLLRDLGYAEYKACRQYVYSPAPCEQGEYSREVPGCGSGPFGEAAVDYFRGPRWSPIENLLKDSEWVAEFERGHDWFDLHAKLPD
eukprot:TRINITY_DN48009_c0_g1_i1.p1 TRINITY_DN48009_c0_g1~~TRINITY_DN48009_c0_g1_i1.p1  ORF type:complete len:438 (-),score=99.03 TRINITY_DN48009_c0_g1_i1:85-1398(-)